MQQQQQQQQYGVFDGAKWLDASQAQHVPEQDLLPFHSWFEGGVGANGDLGDVDEEEEEEEGEGAAVPGGLQVLGIL